MMTKTLTKTRKVIKGNFHKDLKLNACFDEFYGCFNRPLNRLNVLQERALRRPLFFFRNTAIQLGKVLAFSGNPIHSKKKSLLGLKQEIIYAESFDVHRTPMKLLNPHLSSRIEVCSKQNI